MADFWESEREIGSFKKNSRDIICVKEVSLKGKSYIDIRTFYTDKSGDIQPTSKGLTIPTDKVEDLYEILKECVGR